MAASTDVLLAMALCVGAAYSLTCYTCTSQSINNACMTQRKCSANSTFCVTSVVTAGTGSLYSANITKTCSARCILIASNASNAAVASTKVSCCRTNLCNTGSHGVTSTYNLITVSLGFTWTLLSRSSI